MRLPPAPIRLALAAAVLLVGGAPVRPAGAQAARAVDPAADSSLAERVAARVAALPGATIAVEYEDAAGARRLSINAGTEFHAASTMKLPVLMELFRRVDAGGLSLDQPVLLVNRFASIADGSPFALDPASDSDSLLYASVGRRVAVRQLAERMIVRSSNLATNALIALVGPANANAAARAAGARNTAVLRGVEDGRAFARGLVNTTTAADLAAMLLAIERGRAASPASCRAMRDILLRQELNGEIPAGLPPGTPVAHKNGQITATLHDAAIVYPPGHPPYVLVVLTRGIPDERVAATLIADVSRLVWADAIARR